MAETIDFGATVAEVAQSIQAPEGAKPQADIFISHDSPKLVPHVDPYEAAKQIRALSRQLVEQAPALTPKVVVPSITDLKTAIENAYYYSNDFSFYYQSLKEAIPTRKASLITERAFTMNASFQNSYKQQKLAMEYLKVFEVNLKAIKAPAVSGTNAKATAEQIHKLAQSIPTVPTAPVLPVDQVLRAICTILKNAGYINSQGEAVKP